MTGAQGPRRNYGLDVLRCVAILLVLGNHAFLGFFVGLGGAPWEGKARALSMMTAISIEWLFVLSGFLIGTMMIRTFEHEGGRFWWKARSFWLRRWFRTLPNYYLFFLVNTALVALAWHGPLDIGRPSWRHLAFAQNLVQPEVAPYFFNEAWSLALDEWFYLLLPILVGLALLARRTPRGAFLLATGSLIAIPTLLRLATPVPADPLEWDHSVRRVTVMHLDATGWGVLAASVNRWMPAFWHAALRRKAALGAACMALGLLAIQDLFGVLPAAAGGGLLMTFPRLTSALTFVGTGLGTFLALPWIATLRAPGPRWAGAVAWLSNGTYSIYLSHFPILYLFAEVLASPSGLVPTRTLWLAIPVWLAVTVGASSLTYRWFEKTVSDLRERFTRRIDASPFGPATPP